MGTDHSPAAIPPVVIGQADDMRSFVVVVPASEDRPARDSVHASLADAMRSAAAYQRRCIADGMDLPDAVLCLLDAPSPISLGDLRDPPTRSPRKSGSYDDRSLDCQEALEGDIQELLGRATAAGWSMTEALVAVSDVADHLMIAEDENRKTDARIAQLRGNQP